MNEKKLITYDPDSVSRPGETLAEKLSELNIGVKEFALRINKSEKTISDIISGNSSITSDMSIQFEKVLKIPAVFWLKRQSKYDEYVKKQISEQSQSSIS